MPSDVDDVLLWRQLSETEWSGHPFHIHKGRAVSGAWQFQVYRLGVFIGRADTLGDAKMLAEHHHAHEG